MTDALVSEIQRLADQFNKDGTMQAYDKWCVFLREQWPVLRDSLTSLQSEVERLTRELGEARVAFDLQIQGRHDDHVRLTARAETAEAERDEARRELATAHEAILRIGYFTGPMLYSYAGVVRQMTVSQENALAWNKVVENAEKARALKTEA